MRNYVISAVFAFLFLIASPSHTQAIRYAVCDACGLCPTIEVGGTPRCTVTNGSYPGDWVKCAECLYPSLGSNPSPSTCDTLKVDDNTNQPVNPVSRGRQYTMFGCVKADTGFSNQAGAPSLVQVLLNFVFSIGGALAFLYLLYGGYIILTSQADFERLNYGKRLVYGALVGLIFTLSSVFLVNLIGSGVLRLPGFMGTITPTPAP